MAVTELFQSTTAFVDKAVEDVIRSHDFPLSEQARRHLDDLIESVVEMVKSAVLRRKREERSHAHADVTLAHTERAVHGRQLAAFETRYAACPKGSWVLAALLTPFFVACLGMEFILSWVTLPLLFGVDRYSALGIMLGVGPTSAVAVLKIFIARIVEDPYQRLRMAMVQSRVQQFGVLAVVVLFASMLSAYNIYALVLQADVREAVAKAAHHLRAGTSTTVYQPIDSRDAVVAVSVAAAVDGAIFFIVAWNEIHMWRRRRTARQRLERAQARAKELERAVGQAEATLAVRMQEDIEAAAVVAGNRRRAELQIACDQEESRQRQGRSAKAAVDREMQMHLVHAG
jgi:hypothetical protein